MTATRSSDSRPLAHPPATVLLAPLVGTGALMALYLMLRPYGDAGTPPQQAAAWASSAWVVAHLAGIGALASVARLALRLNDLAPGPLTRLARWAGLAGTVAALPAYGAETIALHVLGGRAIEGDAGALDAAAQVRESAAFTGLLGAGLLLLGLAAPASAAAWRVYVAPHGTAGRLGEPRRRGWIRWAGWPLGIGVAALLPQFFLPPAGRVAFGVAYAVAAALWVAAVLATRSRPTAAGA